MSQLAVIQALGNAAEGILQRLPAARDEAMAINERLKAARTRLGEEEAQRRVKELQGKPVPLSALSQQAYSTYVAMNQKWKEYNLDALTTLPPDAGQLAILARQLAEKRETLKKAVVILEAIDQSKAELAVLEGRESVITSGGSVSSSGGAP
ncbi:MAG: hypothetical protein AB2A00_08055 [Myxococcota bacterium]